MTLPRTRCDREYQKFVETSDSQVAMKVVIVGGANIQAIATKTEDYTLVDSDNTILADAASNTVTISLPVSPTHGQVFNVKAIVSVFVVTVGRNGKLIDGVASDLNLVAPTSATLQYDTNYGWAVL